MYANVERYKNFRIAKLKNFHKRFIKKSFAINSKKAKVLST